MLDQKGTASDVLEGKDRGNICRYNALVDYVDENLQLLHAILRQLFQQLFKASALVPKDLHFSRAPFGIWFW